MCKEIRKNTHLYVFNIFLAGTIVNEKKMVPWAMKN